MMPQSSDNEDRPNDKLQESRSSQEPPIFLGQDVDRYITEHMERYETARRRWTECSREEWTKGADGKVDKFGGSLLLELIALRISRTRHKCAKFRMLLIFKFISKLTV